MSSSWWLRRLVRLAEWIHVTFKVCPLCAGDLDFEEDQGLVWAYCSEGCGWRAVVGEVNDG